MATLDPNIALSYRFPQIDTPVQQYQNAFRLQQMQMGMDDMRDKRATDQLIRDALSKVESPEQAIPVLLRSGGLQGVRAAGILAEAVKDLRGKDAAQPQPFTLSPGQRRYGPTGQLVAEAPSAPEKPGAPPELVKLHGFMQTLAPDDPMRKIVQQRIELLTTRQPAVQVNMPSATHMMEGPDGRLYQTRVGKDGRVEHIPLGDMRQPATASDKKAANEVDESEKTVESVRQRVNELAGLLRGGAMAGSVTGPGGIASRIGETAVGVVRQGQPTPAIDFKNKQALLLADVRKMVEKDPNLSKDERERLYETLGGGTFQTTASSLRALDDVLKYVEAKRRLPPGMRPKTPQRAGPTVGTVQDGYRFKGGDPSKKENWEKQ